MNNEVQALTVKLFKLKKKIEDAEDEMKLARQELIDKMDDEGYDNLSVQKGLYTLDVTKYVQRRTVYDVDALKTNLDKSTFKKITNSNMVVNKPKLRALFRKMPKVKKHVLKCIDFEYSVDKEKLESAINRGLVTQKEIDKMSKTSYTTALRLSEK